MGIDYRKVALLSAGAARSTYLSEMPAANPASPLRRYTGGTVVGRARQERLAARAGQCDRALRHPAAEPRRRRCPVQPWIAVVRYTYSRAPMTLEDRLVNPLGFKVLTYRRSAEAPPPVQVQQVPQGQPVVVRPQVFNEGSSTTVVVQPQVQRVDNGRAQFNAPPSSGQ